MKLMTSIALALIAVSVNAEFTLSSPLFEDGDSLPDGLKCERQGGDGLSPPLSWTDVPDDTKSFALIEHHYPRGSVEGVDDPSYYWLLWSIPKETTSISRGNTESVGNEGGGSKFGGTRPYIPPCSPEESGMHTYVITLYALDSEDIGLGDQDNPEVDGASLTGTIEDKVIAQSSLAFASGTPRDRSANRTP
jgi:Raf kinase inhibitor-like YbhB/YbcL family protein